MISPSPLVDDRRPSHVPHPNHQRLGQPSAAIEVGKQRAKAGGLTGLTWKVENAEKLGFADSSFDAYTIVFGIRNVTDIPAALREANRVLKRGGRFFCMEFSSSDWPGFSNLYEAWASNVIPRIGKAVADDEESYRYLVESIRRFPRPNAFKSMVAGLHSILPASTRPRRRISSIISAIRFTALWMACSWSRRFSGVNRSK